MQNEQYQQYEPKEKPPVVDWTSIFNYKEQNNIAPDPFSQLVVYAKPSATPGKLKAWADKAFKNGNVHIISICGSCDTSLILLEGEGEEIKTYIEGVVKGGSTGQTQEIQSEDGPVYLSPNYNVKLPNSNLTDFTQTPPEAFDLNKYKFKENIIDVAVFDTGVEHNAKPEPHALSEYLYKAAAGNQPCIVNADNGWNFIAKNADFNDDHIYRHGTTVSAFIIEQAIIYHNNPVRILPVKVHNKNGESGLFDVLCALSYAKERGAKIINASFGFYSPRPCGLKKKEDYLQSVILFNKFIQRYLTNDIILIAAAGNQDAAFFDPYFRDLDHISFYPASFARNNKRVFAVTTIDDDEVSPIQNFSNNVVDVGVYADTDDFRFLHPLNHSIGVTGSSFAAPVLAGKIAANYDLIKQKLGTQSFIKKNILSVLKNDLSLAKKNTNLEGKIRKGLSIHKGKE